MSRLIDADELMKNIDEQLASHDGLDMFDRETVYLIGVNDVASYIVTAPTVDAESVRHGRWEKVYGDHLSMGHRPWVVCCSVCGRVGMESNYCPHCGAKMDSKDGE